MPHDFLQPINTVFDVLAEELEPDTLERVLRSISSRLDKEAEERREERDQEVEREDQEPRHRPAFLSRSILDLDVQAVLRGSSEYAREMREEDEWLLEQLEHLDLGDS